MIGDGLFEVLGHLAFAQDSTDSLADFTSATQGIFSRVTRAWIFFRSASVSTSSSSRLRWRSAASSGFLHTTNRSPG
jgi:hypothetical protein